MTMKNVIAISAVVFTLGILALPVVWSDNDWDEYKHKSADVFAVKDPIYKEECGSCHMAYPPGLLPEKSWAKIMAGLENHFGDNAELDPQTNHSISQLLQKYSADQSDYLRSRKFDQSIKSNTAPIRISEVPYFIRKHDEIPNRMVSGNPKVKSFSQCDACHSKAEQGSFNEHNIHIPGYGKWDD